MPVICVNPDLVIAVFYCVFDGRQIMHAIGIDIGSTAAKVAVLHQDALQHHFVIPTGWSSAETAQTILQNLSGQGLGRITLTLSPRVMVVYQCPMPTRPLQK